MTKELVSVVMAVYKEPIEFLNEAVDSILNQTYGNFEFIIINDNPQSANLDYLIKLEATNDKILLIKNEENLGLPASLNRGIKAARGSYIARMDADDISCLDRIDEQFNYLQKNNYDLVGCYVDRIDGKGNSIGIGKLPQNPNTLRWLLPYATIAFHPTWFARAELLKSNLYNELFITSQDYELLHRLINKGYKISNLDKPLLKYRINSDSISENKAYIQQEIHRLVNAYQGLTLNQKVSYLLTNYNVHDEKLFMLCKRYFLQKKVNHDFIRCFFCYSFLVYLYKSMLSRLIKRYG